VFMSSQMNRAEKQSNSPELAFEFTYEPVFWSRSQAILAYEQLARRPGDFDASFLSELTKEQTAQLDLFAVDTAIAAAKLLKTPVFVNAFPENIEVMAHRLSLSNTFCQANIGLEVNEDLPLEKFVFLLGKYPDLWWILDDIDMRSDAFETVAHPLVRNNALTAKFHFQSSLHHRESAFDMNLLPSHWMVILEGVKPHMLNTCTKRGVSFIQGRDLGSEVRNVTQTLIRV